MNTFEKLKTMPMNLSGIGLVQNNFAHYFCTPLNSIIFADLGVDGIHFCIISNNDGHDIDSCPVYVVNPTMDEHYVEPVAENLKTFLSLVITTEDAGALECISYSTKEEYNLYLESIDKNNSKVQTIIEKLKDTFDLSEITDVYEYVSSLQRNKNLRKFQYSDEFYDITGLES